MRNLLEDGEYLPLIEQISLNPAADQEGRRIANGPEAYKRICCRAPLIADLNVWCYNACGSIDSP